MASKPRKRADGRYDAYVSYKNNKGERKRAYVYGKTAKECRMKAYDLEQDIKDGLIIKDNTVTYKAVADQWLKLIKPHKAKSTFEGYERQYRKYQLPYMGHIKIKDITTSMLNEFFNDMITELDLSPTTVNKHQIEVNQIFNHALDNDFIKKNPMERVIKIRPDDFIGCPLSNDQYRVLWSLIKDTDDELPIALASLCGLRRSEVWGLKWNKVDFINKRILIDEVEVRVLTTVTKEPKTKNSRRFVPLTPRMYDILLSHFKKQNATGNDRVVPYWTQGSYTKRYKKIVLKELQLPDNIYKRTRFHDLRHYFATHLLAEGVDIKVVSKLMGHANSTVTRTVYQHITDDLYEQTIGMIENSFNKVIEGPQRNNQKVVDITK